MTSGNRPLMNLGALVPLLLLAATPVMALDLQDPDRSTKTEPTLIFRASDVRQQALPARFHTRSLPPVFGSQVVMACLGLPMQPDDLVLYYPLSKKCSLLGPDERHRDTLFSSASLRESSVASGKTVEFLVIDSATTDNPVAAGVCTCPNNQPPEANLRTGSPQDVVAGAVIAEIGFTATDPDSEVLYESFSYTVDGSGIVAGLPPGLDKVCNSSPNTLACDVNGNAPQAAGNYQLRFTVSDGTLSDTASAILNVQEGVEINLIFRDGFEHSL